MLDYSGGDGAARDVRWRSGLDQIGTDAGAYRLQRCTEPAKTRPRGAVKSLLVSYTASPLCDVTSLSLTLDQFYFACVRRYNNIDSN